MMKITIAYMILSIAAIATLAVLLIKCKNKSCDTFCICKGINKKNCRTPKQKTYNYDNGQTEYSKFKPRKWGDETNFSKY